jgi:threonine dehydrogenase-like Zn-dependent dehydrogenase
MRALVYHGPGQNAWEEVQKPRVTEDTDAVVRVDAVTVDRVRGMVSASDAGRGG